MDESSVCNDEAPGEALPVELLAQPGNDRRKLLPRKRRTAGERHLAEGIEAEADPATCGVDQPAGDDLREIQHGILGRSTKVEFDHRCRIEVHVGQQRLEAREVTGNSEALRADGARVDEMQGIRAMAEIGDDLRMGRLDIGMLDARGDVPGAGLGAQGAGRLVLQAGIERLDVDAIGTARHEPLEGRALEHAIDQCPPLRLVGRREDISEMQIGSHAVFWHASTLAANESLVVAEVAEPSAPACRAGGPRPAPAWHRCRR